MSTSVMTAAVAAVSFAPLDAAAVSAPQAGDSLGGALSDTMAELIDAIVAADQMMASITAYRARLIDQARSLSELSARTTAPQCSASDRPGGWDAATVAHRELVTELACALRLPERSTETLVAHSALLATRLPSTLDALEKGEISYRHAQSIADHAASLPEETAGDFETAVLPAARTLTVARFERAARVQRERMHPESIEARHTASAVDRSVSVTPARDGMAWLSAYLPAADAIAIHNRLWDLAGSLASKTGSPANKTGSPTSKTEQRTRTQLMSDVLVDLLVDGEIVSPDGQHSIGGGIRATVMVTVPVLALLGLDSPPATLEGFGPIDARIARELAATAPGFTRILTHPETGAVLSVGRDRYSPPVDLRRYLRVRDETCRFPGCGRLAGNCDLDHTVDWQTRGPTDHDNLAHLCPGHHHVKHHTRWSVEQLDGGVLQWTSPLGRTYLTNPALRIGSAAA
ncbi:protein of unknown function [Salinibacterium xinjiangense]|uniref:HNH nuclease domain-containing protein n=2 Tax=Salinibacterium xinjiangense TaxID=386302 RepID=A0A2C8Z2T4_9MICO|nr:protein of unknown function [Salinibacterium xinjiangense]